MTPSKRSLFLWILGGVLCLELTSPQRGLSSTTKNNHPLVPALKSVASNTQLSALFIRLSDGQILYEAEAQKLLIPASLVKLITAGASLERWGGHHQFSTSVWTDAISHPHPNKTAVTVKNLYIKGGGDPALVNEKLWELANALKNRKITKIAGDLVLDQSFFSSQGIPYLQRNPQKFSDHAYDAPLAPLAVNFSTYELWVSAALSPLAPAPQVALLPYPRKGIQVSQALTTSSQGGKLQVIRKTTPQGISLEARGNFQAKPQGQQQNPRRFYRSAVEASFFAGKLIQAFLEKEGITIQGKIRSGKIPPAGSRIHLYTLKGYELHKLVRDMNTYSNNFIADMLALNLGSQNSAPQVSWTRSLTALKDFTHKNAGPFPPGARIVNGSGLEGTHRLSTQMIVGVLRSMFQNMKIFPDFLASLAVPGGPGTLKSRLKNLSTIRAKTGSLSQPVVVCSLAGYGLDPHHGFYAFAMIHNGIAGKSSPSLGTLYKVQEKALEEILSSFKKEPQ